MKRLMLIAGLAALAGCAGVEGDDGEVTTASHAMFGANMFGANMFGANMFGANMFGANGANATGIAANGLGPNFAAEALDVVVDTAARTLYIRNARFDAWFQTNPVEFELGMRYFARCWLAQGYTLVYDRKNPATGLAYTWPGQYGFGQASALLGGRITPDEGLWISSCLLAHINVKHMHQYISVRTAGAAAPYSPTLTTTDGEHWSMRQYHGAYFGDLFSVGVERFSCRQPKDFCDKSENPVCTPPDFYQDIVLGRRCDGYLCTYTEPTTGQVGTLVDNRGWCGDTTVVRHGGDTMRPLYAAQITAPVAARKEYHPVYVNAPVFVDLENAYLAPAAAVNRFGLTDVLSTGTIPFKISQKVACQAEGCLRPLTDRGNMTGHKLYGLSAGQRVEALVRWVPTMWPSSLEPVGWTPKINATAPVGTPFTAIIRYSYAGKRNGVAGVSVANTSGALAMTNLGPVLFPPTLSATGAPSWDSYQYLQVYPVYGINDERNSATPVLKVGLYGIAANASCTGLATLEGPACLARDAPMVDAVAFVPGRPWCATRTTSFVGTCPNN